MKPEDIQTLIYSTGKENGYAENLRDWFKLIYEVIFGDENGPRMGFFISFFALFGLGYIYKAKLSGDAYLNHSSMEIPFPFDFEIFSPFSSKNNS